MSDTIFALLIGLAVGVSAMLAFHSLTTLKTDVPVEDREYMDPLPPMLNMAWPLILFIEYHLTSRFPPDWLEQTHKRLQETGVGYLMSAEQFYAVRVFGVFVAVVMGSIPLAAIESLDLAWIILLAIVGFYFPIIWLRDVRSRRQKDVLRALPVYLDFITMAVEAGLNLNGALNQAMDKGPPGPLRNEFYMVVRDLRAGVPRADALRRMEKRLDMEEIASFVGTVIQAEKMGARLGTALRVQALQRRTERFQRAEKLAMEAPVKLILPLIVFIFPVTFIVLAFPIAMKFLMEGML
ncbi:MAG: type II secretion system F family protein [Burkholderiaceae bacterium]|nr:type II secretion system F family protein [Sulfuritalea sp.]MCF8173935.1 type II secretion system F family protein [Burkholderiaceae bacterium]